MIFISAILIVYLQLMAITIIGTFVTRRTRSIGLRVLILIASFAPLIAPFFAETNPNSWIYRLPLMCFRAGWIFAVPLLLFWGRNFWRYALVLRGEREIIRSARMLPTLRFNGLLGYDRIALEEGLAEAPELLCHNTISSPLLLGFPAKIILPAREVPAEFLQESKYWDVSKSAGASVERLKEILRHECVHVSKWDPALRFLQTFYYLLFGPDVLMKRSDAHKSTKGALGDFWHILISPVQSLLESERDASEALARGIKATESPTLNLGVLLVAVSGLLMVLSPSSTLFRISLTGREFFRNYLPEGCVFDIPDGVKIGFGSERTPSGDFKVILSATLQQGQEVALGFPGIPTNSQGYPEIHVSHNGKRNPEISATVFSEPALADGGKFFGTYWQTTYLEPFSVSEGGSGWSFTRFLGRHQPGKWLVQSPSTSRKTLVPGGYLRIKFDSPGDLQAAVMAL